MLRDVVQCGKNVLTFRVYDTDIVLSFYTSVNLYQATRRHIPTDGTLRCHCTQKPQISQTLF